MNTLRHMFEHNSRFLELSTWILEVLIASMIAYELGSAIWHKWRSKQRFKQLYKLLQQGQGLHWSAPHYSAHDMAWEGRVKAWIHDTHAFLQQYSPEAAEFFLQQPKADYFTVADNIVFWTNVLFERIEHLRHVIETPDVYF